MNLEYPGYEARGQAGVTALESLLVAIAETLDVPPSAYEQAVERYAAVGDWLCREGSSLQAQRPVVYPQGSVALGTIVRPLLGDDYDVDAVVELAGPQRAWEPAELKSAVGTRLRESDVYQPMLEPEGRRCWTLKYSSEAGAHGFHLDLLPSVPVSGRVSESTAIAITNRISRAEVDWRESDPKMYATWFRERMQPISKRRVLVDKVAGVEPVPQYGERVPLQHVVQLLKRYRDVLFQSDSEHAPISVIITTLCAKAYEGEDTLEESLLGVLARMSKFVEHDGARVVIPNPVRPAENFADRWEDSPQKERAFLRWLDAAERLRHELLSGSPDQLGPILSKVLGDASARTTLAKYASRRDAVRARSIVQPTQSSTTTTGFARRAGGVLSGWMRLLDEALHRQAPPWPIRLDGTALAIRGTVLDARGAFRGTLAADDTVDVGASLRFEVIPATLGAEIYWQVTNTGSEARNANDLRGRFEAGTSVKKETARYRGTHFIECFAIRSGVCVARSGEFVVNIR